MINNLVFSAMLIPGVIFGGLFLVPWIERRLTGDTAEHHLLDRPRDAPGRTATGAAAITVRHRAVPRRRPGRDRRHVRHARSATSRRSCRSPPSSPRRSSATSRTGVCQALPLAAGARAHRARRRDRPRPRRRLPTTAIETSRRADGRRRRVRSAGAGAARDRRGRRRRSPSRPTTSIAIWNGFLLIAVARRGVSSPCSSCYVVVRFRRRDDRLPPPGAREHPDGGRLHGRCRCSSWSGCSRSRSCSVRAARQRRRRPRRRRRRAPASSGSGSSTTRSPG